MNNKSDLQVQSIVGKSTVEDTEVSTEFISSTATPCSPKTIYIEMDQPASLSVSVTAPSPFSGYQLINTSILVDVFMLLSCPGCHCIQCLKLCDIKEKSQVCHDICNSVALFIYIATHFSP